MSKPRPDSKLEPHRADLFPRMKLGESYHSLCRWLEEEHGVRTSLAALSTAWNKWSREDLEERVLKSKTGADDIMELIDNPEQLDEALLLAIKQSAFEMALSKGDPDSIKKFCTIILKHKQLDQDQQKITLMQFDAAKAALMHAAEFKAIAADKGMSEDDKITAVRRRLFSVLPEDANG